MVEGIAEQDVWPKYNDLLLNLVIPYTGSSNPRIKFLAKKFYASTFNNIGYLHNMKNDLFKAEQYYLKSIKVMEELGDIKGLAAGYNNMGYVYKTQGNTSKAVDFYHKSLALYEKCGELYGIGNAFNNLAVIIHKQGDLEKALEYNLKSLEINRKLNHKRSIATSLNNIGLIYQKIDKMDLALKHLHEARAIYKDIEDLAGEANALLNIGVVYEYNKDLPTAEKYYKESLDILSKVDDKQAQSNLFMNLGALYLKQNKTDLAKSYGKRSWDLAKEIGFVEELYDASDFLSKVYEKEGKYFDALKMYKYYISLRDSVVNEQIKKSTLQKYYQYNYQRKSAEDSVKNVEHRKVQEAELAAKDSALKQERTQRFALYGGLILVLVFSAFTYNRFKKIEQQNKIIEAQKKEVDAQRELADSRRIIAEEQREIIEQKSHEIIDSINYAKRLQDATLPDLEFVKNYLPELFALYKPKDIVAGDFYWFETTEDFIYIAAADSTGHGVPGAMVSVVCSNALYRAVNEFSIRDTGKILDKVRELVIQTFAKSDKQVKDGMDISLMRIPIKKNESLQWSGANNPLWYVCDNKLIEIKGDKQPIGMSDNAKTFSTQKISWQKGNVYYLFTDGYADQFGGESGKKFKTSHLKEEVLVVSNRPMEDQKNYLDMLLNKWMINQEQVDDICILGIRLS